MRAVLLRRILITGVTSLGWFTPVFAAQPPSENDTGVIDKGVNVMTRYMMIFGSLEKELLGAQASGNKPKLIAHINPFFELNTYNHQRLTRKAFIERSTGSGQQEISGLRVYEVGDNAIANFVLHTQNQEDLAIVDVWSKNGQDWQLRLRFESKY